jgi:hypothetical protein
MKAVKAFLLNLVAPTSAWAAIEIGPRLRRGDVRGRKVPVIYYSPTPCSGLGNVSEGRANQT